MLSASSITLVKGNKNKSTSKQSMFALISCYRNLKAGYPITYPITLGTVLSPILNTALSPILSVVLGTLVA